MADINQLETALRNADAAGDVEAARSLAGEIQKQRTTSTPAAAPEQSGWDKFSGVVRNELGKRTEPAMNIASSMIATPVSGLAGLGAIGTNALGLTDVEPADVVNRVGGALTYQPRSEGGKAVSQVANYPFEKLSQGANWAGGKTTDVTGSPAAGAAVNTGIQMLPTILTGGALRGIGRAKPSAIPRPRVEPTIDPESIATPATSGVAPEVVRAQDYVARNTSLDWNALSDSVKSRLTDIARDATTLDKLDPQAVERQARLESLGLPATKGQLTRNLSQLTREEAITKGDPGEPLRNINIEQDRILHQHLDTLRATTGGKAATRQQVGQSVQGATRGKLNTLEADYQAKYKAARDSGETLAPADITPLNEWLGNPTNRRNAPYLEKAIQDYTKDGKVSINDLEEIRKEAVANALGPPSPAKHFAGEAVGVIDGVLDQAGSNVYKDARAAFRATKEEFSRQGRVRGLVSEKGGTTDRSVALEDTFDNVVLRGSNEELQTVRDSLTKGGDAKTQANGQQAWKDLQASTIDFLKDKAAGKRAIPGEKSQLQFNSTFLDALYDLDKDGKLDTLFGDGTATKLRDLATATRDVRTKPTGRIAGSDTTPRLLAFLDKLSALPGPTKYVVGAARKFSEIGKAGEVERDVRAAQRTPLDDAQRSTANTVRDIRRRSDLKKGARILPAMPKPEESP